MTRRRSAFTLVEMLIVMAIILLLGAMLYPALLNVQENGRTTRCASNLRQLHLAAINFAAQSGHLPAAASYSGSRISDPEDYRAGNRWTHNHVKGWVAWDFVNEPRISPATPVYPPGYTWRRQLGNNSGISCITNGALFPFIGTTVRDIGVYLCPTFALPRNCGVNDAVIGYAMNSNLSENVVAHITNASQRVLFGDMKTNVVALNGGFLYQATQADGGTGAAARTPSVYLGQWHRGGGNVVFLDGHVERLK